MAEDEFVDDSSSRLSRIEAPGAEMINYGYDGYLLTSLTSEGSSAGTVAYGYDSDFRLSSRSINGGSATTFSYNKDGLLTTAGALSLSWDATNGYLNSTTTGGTTPVTTSHTYSSFGEPAATTASYGSTQLHSVSFERDKLGRIPKKTETIGGVTSVHDYTYDIRGRLTEVKKDGASTHTFSYDANGNRTGATGPSGTVTATYDAQDRMTSYGGATYTYTENGELKTKTDSGGTTSYEYDELGNLVKVTLPNSTVIEYAIDGLGRRIAKKVNGAVTQRFLYGTGLLPVAELDASRNVVASFTYASKSHSPDLMTKGGVTYRIVSDHLGSPRLVVNASTGEIVQRIDYDTFGNVTSDTNPGFQPFGFSGGLYDSDTRLARFGARDYDAQTGRWTAKDVIRFEGGDANLYSYVASDPVNLFDPTGLVSCSSSPDYYDIREHADFWDCQAHAGLDNPNAIAGFFQWGTAKLLGGALDLSGLDTVQANAEILGEICTSGWEKAKAFGGIALVGVSWYGGVSAAFARVGWSGLLFGRGGNTAITKSNFKGILNRWPVRIGWGWNDETGKAVFRLAIGSKRGHRHFDFWSHPWWP